MSRKQNNIDLEKRFAQREKYIHDATMDVTINMVTDAAIIAVNRAFGIGKGRMKRFTEALGQALYDIGDLIEKDGTENGDDHFNYAKGKIDQCLKELVPDEDFLPWERRYGCAMQLPGRDIGKGERL